MTVESTKALAAPAPTTTTTRTPAPPDMQPFEDPCDMTLRVMGRYMPYTRENRVHCLRRLLDKTLGVKRGGYGRRIKAGGVELAGKLEKWDEWDNDPERYTSADEAFINGEGARLALRELRNAGGAAFWGAGGGAQSPSPGASRSPAPAPAPAPSPRATAATVVSADEALLRALPAPLDPQDSRQDASPAPSLRGAELKAVAPTGAAVDSWLGAVEAEADGDAAGTGGGAGGAGSAGGAGGAGGSAGGSSGGNPGGSGRSERGGGSGSASPWKAASSNVPPGEDSHILENALKPEPGEGAEKKKKKVELVLPSTAKDEEAKFYNKPAMDKPKDDSLRRRRRRR